MDFAILRYTQPANTISLQYAEDLYAKLCKAPNADDESIQGHLSQGRQLLNMAQLALILCQAPTCGRDRYCLQGPVANSDSKWFRDISIIRQP